MPNAVTFPLLGFLCMLGLAAGITLAAKGVRAIWTRTPFFAPSPTGRHPALRQGLAITFYGLLFALPGAIVLMVIISQFGVHALLFGPPAVSPAVATDGHASRH